MPKSFESLWELKKKKSLHKICKLWLYFYIYNFISAQNKHKIWSYTSSPSIFPNLPESNIFYAKEICCPCLCRAIGLSPGADPLAGHTQPRGSCVLLVQGCRSGDQQNFYSIPSNYHSPSRPSLLLIFLPIFKESKNKCVFVSIFLIYYVIAAERAHMNVQWLNCRILKSQSLSCAQYGYFPRDEHEALA